MNIFSTSKQLTTVNIYKNVQAEWKHTAQMLLVHVREYKRALSVLGKASASKTFYITKAQALANVNRYRAAVKRFMKLEQQARKDLTLLRGYLTQTLTQTLTPTM